VKNHRLADVEQRLVRSWSEPSPGRIHDKRICELEEPGFPPEIPLFQDTGFQGYHPPGVTMYQPKKKPTGDELTAAEKADNHLIASIRIGVEPIISGVKRCRMVKEVFRHTKEFFADQVREIACGLHNFSTTLRQHALE
jgi:DDE superfamily endonuclease